MTANDKPEIASSSSTVDEAVKSVPGIGPFLLVIIKKWGWIGILLFFSGFIFALALVYFGLVSERLVNDRYRPTVQKPESIFKPRIIPAHIPIDSTHDKSDWLNFIVQSLRLEGSINKSGFGEPDPSIHFGVAAVEHQVPNATKNFTWSLRTDSQYSISGRGYRLTKEGFVQPLEVDLNESGHSISFTVPECDEGDKLIAVVRLTWTHDLPVENILSTFVSGVN